MNIPQEHDALLIVDVQQDFLPGGALAVPDGDEVIPVLSEVDEIFSEKGLPVAASRDWHPPDHCSFQQQGGSWPPHCVAGTDGAQLDSRLDLNPDVKIVNKGTQEEKDAYSAFQGTDLADWLESNGVERLILGGLTTEYCVLNTVEDAVENGFDVVLLSDGVRAIDPAAGKDAVESMREMEVTIAKSDDLHDEDE